MQKSELIEMLQESIDLYGDGEVRLGTQENWPFEHSIQGTVEGRTLSEDADDRPQVEDLTIEDLEEIARNAGLKIPDKDKPRATRKKLLMAGVRYRDELQEWMNAQFGEPEKSEYHDYFYIVEGGQLGYFTKNAWNC